MEIYKSYDVDKLTMKEEISYTYTTDDVMLNEPCKVKYMGLIYPVLVSNYNNFLRNVKFLMIGENQVKEMRKAQNSDINVLQGALLLGLMELSQGKANVDDGYIEKCFDKVASEIAKLVSIVARKEIKYTYDVSGSNISASFFDEENSIVVNDSNWETFRKVVMGQNNIEEIKVYEDKITQEWMEKAKRARQDENNNITIGDILAIVSGATGKSYAELKEQNILQLNADYHRVAHVENYRTIATYQSEEIKNVKFINGIIQELYKDRTDELFIDESSLGIG